MFTGIVTDIGEVIATEQHAEGLRRLTGGCGFAPATIATGKDNFAVDAAAETLAVTTVGRWRNGARVNLERSLKIGDELGGHLVSGHVDGLAELVARDDLTEMAKLTLRVPKPLARFIAQKGSVALDGVSLTVNEVEADTFSVFIIPHTLAVSTLGALKLGDALNLEVD